MHITGIIAEYNPLHSGHIYHIQETKKQTNTDFIITILSGNFVQRGLPAVCDKHTRTKMALLGGSDLVLELPSHYALSSAEGFAFGGVSLLNALHCVNSLSFGSEAGSLRDIKLVASILSDESSVYSDAYKSLLKSGLTPPLARKCALERCYPDLNTSFLDEQSNNLLGLEYCKALNQLNSTIQPITIKRDGDAYHSQTIQHVHPSATHIRHCLQQSIALPGEASLPEYVNHLLSDKKSKNDLLFLDDFSMLLKYKLWSLSTDDYLYYKDITEPLANKITNNLTHFTSFTDFANLLWTKDLTYARVCRSLMYLLLEIKKDSWDVKASVPYARILGFKRDSSALLNHMKAHTSIPLISKLADSYSLLNEDALHLLDDELKHSHIYEAVRTNKTNTPFVHEMKKQIVII